MLYEFWLFFAVFRFSSNLSTEQNTTIINSESNATADQVNHRDNNSKERSAADNKVSNSSNGKQSSSSSSLGKRRKSTKSKKSHQQQQQQQLGDSNINYKNLDEWLENSIKGMSVNDNFMPNHGSPIHGTSSAFTVNNSNPFINTHHPLFNPNMLPPYMARPWSEMVCYVIRIIL